MLQKDSVAFSKSAEDMAYSKESQFDSHPKQQNKKIPGISKTMLAAAVVGTVGQSVVAGYNLGVVNAPETILKNFCNNSLWKQDDQMVLSDTSLDVLWSLIVSAFLFGAMIGSFIACFVANLFGRKVTLFFNGILGLVTAALFGFTKLLESVPALVIGRVIIGIFSGVATSVVPMYLMEAAPTHLKGAMGALMPMGLTAGVLISQLLGQAQVLGTNENWPFLLSAYALFIAFGLLLLAFCPESPSYLFLKKKDEKAAIKALERFRGAPIEDLMDDLLNLKKEQKIQDSCPPWSMMQVLRAKELRIPLLLVIAMQAGQQLSGISNVFYYSTRTFAKLGMSQQESQYGSIGTAVMNVVMSAVSVPLVNCSNRRKLLQISLPGMMLCLIGFTISSTLQNLTLWMPYMTVTFLICVVGAYGIGLGPLPYMIGSELFQQGPRAAAMGIGCLANWFSNFSMAMMFPLLQALVGEYVFLMYAGCVLALAIFLYFFLPETKGLEPVEVGALFLAKTNPSPVQQMVMNDSQDLISSV